MCAGACVHVRSRSQVSVGMGACVGVSIRCQAGDRGLDGVWQAGVCTCIWLGQAEAARESFWGPKPAPGPVSRVLPQLCWGDPGQVCGGSRDSFTDCAQVIQVGWGGGEEGGPRRALESLEPWGGG